MLRKSTLLLLFVMAVHLLQAQSLKLSGTVVDAADKQPLIGVGVIIKGTTNGTVTDLDGNFTISTKKGDVVQISYIGYKTFEQKINTQTSLQVELQTDNIMLDEVVAIGYGTMKKSDLTGAVASIRADKLQKTPAAGIDMALQGRAAGVTVTSNSGQPGSDATIRIRGIGTVNGAEPIYVVDGIIVSDIKFLSPNDIASTEILKDASSTAIYGSRGANGVILITTKQGAAGKTTVTFDAYFGMQNRWRKLDLMQSNEFAKTIIELNNVRSEMKYFEERGFNNWLRAYRLGNSPYFPTVYSSTNKEGLNYGQIETDWQDEVFNAMAPVQNYSVSVQGGSNKSNYVISASYFNQQGTIIGSDYQRLTLRASSSHQIKNWLKIGENLSFMTSTGRNAMNNSSSPGASVLSAALAMAPWDPTHYPDGSVNSAGKDLSGQIAASSNFRNANNPFSMVEHSHPNAQAERWVGDIYVELTPIKGLSLRSSLSMDLSNNRDRLFKDAYHYSSYDQSELNYISSSMSRYCTLIMQNIATYSNSVGKHDYSVMLGQTTEQYNYYSISGAGSAILNPKEHNWYLSQASQDRTFSSDGVDQARMVSMLGRLHYSFDRKLMLTVNFRADGSSKFPQNLWGYFPSTAVAWRLSEEPFMKQFSNLDNLKIRAGWGQIGNDKISSGTFITKMFNTGPTFVDYVLGTEQKAASGATVLTYSNKNGKWETTEQMNAAVDFGFWNGLLSGSVDFFVRNTSDMLLSVKAPAHVGNRYDPSANVGTVNNTGVEITLDHTKRFNDFAHNISGNVSFVKNKLTHLNGGERVMWDYQISDEGLPLFSFYGYEYEGIYRSDDEANEHLYAYGDNNPYKMGDAKFKDIHKDGVIDDKDKTVLGNPFPWLTYALNYGLEYKGFDAQIFFQGVYGNQIYNAVRLRTEGTGTESTLSTTMRNAWTPQNLNGDIPNPYGSSHNKAVSSRFVESGAYLRLKNIQIGYSLPKAVIQKAAINRCRFYLSANNLLTFTPYTGYDPEVGGGVDYGNYPQALTVTVGVNLEF